MIKKQYLIYLSFLLLTGCGFHLRGSTTPFVIPFETVSISPYQPNDVFYRRLTRILEAHQVQIAPNSAVQLKISPPILKTYPVAFGPNGELVREKLELSFHYQLVQDDQVVLDKSLQNVRQHQLNIATKLADNAQVAVILVEMHNDLAQQLVLQLARV